MTGRCTLRKAMVSVVLAVVLCVSALACSNGSGGNGPGVGGGGSTGGTGVGGTGIGGTGVGGTGAGGDLQLPGCVSSVVASCPLQGACASAMRDAGEVTDVCFASGTHVVVTNRPGANSCGSFVTVASVTKPDGSPCFSFESYIDPTMACEGIRYTWKNTAGQVIANGFRNPFSAPTLSIACATSSETHSCDNGALTGGPSNDCCDITGLGVPTCSYPQCTLGGCAAPN
jgi:hypothetical protein